MANSVDERITRLQFDSASFEAKVADVIQSLDKLKTSLDFSASKQNFGELDRAARSFTMEHIATAVDGIAQKFTAMGAVAFSVINNLVSRVVDAGIQIAKSLSLDQVLSGFSEYETNINSIQTILSNTRSDGTNLEQVNAALDKLNEYSDQTIYNFSQMAKNIGTFTAAGVDLDTSVGAIKGIANLAAVSGSSAEQASSAMYQLSQALASGKVRLIDWISVRNAGMGGEVFQKALFETGKALGAIKNVGLDTTFESWAAANGGFAATLEQDWLSTEVLTKTLEGFTGDLTEAQLLAMGYTEAQAKEIQAMGEDAKNAATKVKTFTQLLGTLKETVGSGWAQSFRTIFGDFEEARSLFTGLSEYFGGLAKASAEARNSMLNDWADLGGRELLIQSLMYAFQALESVLKPIKDAFREIFPKSSGFDLYMMTLNLRNFVRELTLSEQSMRAVKSIAKGVFAAFEIGWEIIKNLADSIGRVIDHFRDDSGEGFLAWLAGIADKITGVRAALVEGGGIEQFFIKWTDALIKFVETAKQKFDEAKQFVTDFVMFFKDGFTGMGTNEGEGIMLFANRMGMFLGDLKDKLPEVVNKVRDFFSSIQLNDNVRGAMDKVSEWFDATKEFFAGSDIPGDVDKVKESFDGLTGVLDWFKEVTGDVEGAWDKVMTKMAEAKENFDGVAQSIEDAFGSIPEKLGELFDGTSADDILNMANTGIFAGLVLIFKRFTDSFKGLTDLGTDISKLLGEVTDTLEAMQLKLKAEALMNIAKALALLTASVIVLSLINDDALVRSMAALAIGFGYLVTAMALLNQIISSPVSAAKLATLSAALIALAGAMVILAVAAKIFSTMSWEELAKGIGSVTVLLGALALVVKPMSANSAGMIRAGIGMMAIASALVILAAAVKLFSMMDWDEMAQGLVGIGAGLGIMVAGMVLMPSAGALRKGFALIELAAALNLLAIAVLQFGSMDLVTLGQGLLGVAGVLLVLAGALRIFPTKDLIYQGAGLLAIGIGLKSMAEAVISLSTLSWEDLARGLTGLAGTLVLLAAASMTMSGTLAGAAAIAILSVALIALAKGMTMMGKLKWQEIVTGLAALAGAMLIFAGGAALMGSISGPLLAVGAALLLFGGAVALAGAGVWLLADGLAILATAGSAGIAILLEALWGIIEALPQFIAALGEGLIEVVKRVVAALPEIIPGLSKALTALLQLIIDNIPKIMETLKTLLLEGLQAVREIFPEVVKTGFEMLMALLHGIEDNIQEIVNTVVNIITKFLDTLGERMPDIVDSVFNFIKDVVSAVIEKLVDIGAWLLPKGKELLEGLWNGIKEAAESVKNWFLDLPGNVLDWLGDLTTWLADKGWDLLTGFFNGIKDLAPEVMNWFVNLPGKAIEWIGDVLETLFNKGKQIIRGLWNGAKELLLEVKDWFLGMPERIIKWIDDAVDWLIDIGKDIIDGLWDGATEKWGELIDWLKGLGTAAFDAAWEIVDCLLDVGKEIIDGLWEGMKEAWEKVKDWLSNLNPVSWFNDINPDKGHAIKNMVPAGEQAFQGLHNGMKDGWDKTTKWLKSLDPSEYVNMELDTASVNKTFEAIVSKLDNMEEFHPTITPVLDLTNVQNGSRQLNAMFGNPGTITPNLSTGHANVLALEPEEDDAPQTDSFGGPSEISYTQIINSPKPLKTTDIYVNTKNQLAMAKEDIVNAHH